MKKIMNVDSRRRPAIRFKNIKDIFGNGNADVSLPNFQPRFVLGALSFDCDPTKNRSQCLPIGEKNVKIEAEASESDCSGADGGVGSDDLDSPTFSNMTLKQIKEMCRAKKRKLSNYGNSMNETAKFVPCEYPDSILKVEECDLEEPLSSWKFRLSKRRKAKKEHMKHCTSSLSQPTASSVKYFQSDEDSPQANRNLVDHLNIKTEDYEHGYSDCQITTPHADLSPVSTTELCSGVGYNEMPETIKVLESQVPRSPTKQLQPCESDYSDCQVMTAYEYLSPVCTMKLSSEVVSFDMPETIKVLEPQVPISPTKKPQSCEPDYSDYRVMTAYDDLSPVCTMQLSCEVVSTKVPSEVVSTEVPETINVLEPQVQTSPSKQPQSCISGELDEHVEHVDPDACVSGGDNIQVDIPGITSEQYSVSRTIILGSEVPVSPTKQVQCCVNEVSNEYRESLNPESIFDVDAYGWEIVKVDIPRVPAEQNSLLKTSVLESQVPTPLTILPQYCAVNEMCYEYREQDDLGSNLDVDASGWEIIPVGSPAITIPRYSELPIPKLGDGSCVIHALPYCVPQETDGTTQDRCVAYNTILNHSLMEEALCQTSHNSQIDLPDMEMVANVQCFEFNNKDTASLFVDCVKDGSPSNLKGNASSGTDGCLISVDQHSAPDKGKQSLYPDYDNGAEDCSTTSHSCSVPNDQKTLVGTGGHCTEMHHPPEKLLSKRKAISPSSQERLCKAMERTKLPDNDHRKCKGKLYFSRQNNHRILRAEGLHQIRIAEVSDVCTKQTNRKPKCNKQSPNENGNARIPNTSQGLPRFSTGGASIEGCSQSAIEFSQRQMRDVEGLATKLTKDLKSMKVIMKEVLDPEVCPVTFSKQNMDKLRAAVENATRAEETTRRWISAMARDCNRFCKLMRLIQKSSSSKEVVPKERKKITFADETGGKLCHVKVFEDDMASRLGSCTEQQELLVKL